jgi:hypothetical protein
VVRNKQKVPALATTDTHCKIDFASVVMDSATVVVRLYSGDSTFYALSFILANPAAKINAMLRLQPAFCFTKNFTAKRATH